MKESREHSSLIFSTEENDSQLRISKLFSEAALTEQFDINENEKKNFYGLCYLKLYVPMILSCSDYSPKLELELIEELEKIDENAKKEFSDIKDKLQKKNLEKFSDKESSTEKNISESNQFILEENLELIEEIERKIIDIIEINFTNTYFNHKNLSKVLLVINELYKSHESEKNKITYILLKQYKKIFTDYVEGNTMLEQYYSRIGAKYLFYNYQFLLQILYLNNPENFNEIFSSEDFMLKNLGTYETDEIGYQYELFIHIIQGGKVPQERFNVNSKECSKKFLTGCLGQLAMNIASQGKKSNLQLSHYNNTYPFICYTLLDRINTSEKQMLSKQLQVFFDKIIKVNNRVKKEEQANIALFIFEHQTQIIQAINIMGISGIDYLSSFLAETTLSLARTLSLFPSFTDEEQLMLAEYFKQHNLTFKKNPEQVIAFMHCMIAIKNLMLGNTSISTILIKETINLAPKDLLLNLNKQMLHLLLGGEEEANKINEVDILKMSERIRPERLAQLISAGVHMDSNEYQKIYFNLLKIDLLGNGFDTFLHDDTQEDELGKQLASHNIKIHNKLKEFGISPENALSYKKQLAFNFKPVSEEKKSIQPDTVGSSYIQKLYNSISELSLNEEQYRSVIKDLQKIQEHAKQLLTRYKDSDLSLKKPNNLIQNILSLLKKIRSENNNISTGFNEFSQHVLDHFTNITSKINTTQKGSNKSYDFLIEQWPKSHVDTFFLGDEVGCCLATTNSQFHAMVQRRMDDAMLFHVAIDQRTKKPVALIWLYLAETKDNQIVLIANFFEVNTKYAIDESLRLALLNGLLQFTE